MTPFHVNLGHLFAHPYESDYATLRRVLSANPGVPLSALEAALRKTPPWQGSFLARVRRLQGRSVAKILDPQRLLKDSYRRQCPQCAEHLYHTPAYIFPWLSHCPIHDCPLTDHCPKCQQPWPSVQEIDQRECPGCGRMSLDDLTRPPQVLNCRPIADIYEFICDDQPAHKLGGGRGIYLRAWIDYWWRAFTPRDPLYAACQAHRRPDFSAAQLDALHITRPPIRYRSTSLTLNTADPVNPFVTRRRPYLSLDLSLTSPRRLTQDYMVMQHLVAWIAAQVPGHPLHLANYRNVHTDHLRDMAEPCPYCLALSLWFFHTAAKRYGQYYAKYIDHYPFWHEASCPGFFDVWEPYVELRDSREVFFPDEEFTTWFYRRGLELLFVHILRHVFDWQRRLRWCRQEKIPPFYYLHTPSIAYEFADLRYASALRDDTFTFFYEHEHPLEHYVPEDTADLDDRCWRFHRDLVEQRPSMAPFDHVLPAPGLSYEAFLTAHQAFRDFLKREFERSILIETGGPSARNNTMSLIDWLLEPKNRLVRPRPD